MGDGYTKYDQVKRGDERVFLTQRELADRWRISPRTLERWRWLKSGPAYFRIGGRIVYRLEDIRNFEMDRSRGADGPNGGGGGDDGDDVREPADSTP